jgi:hypothetical protein
MNREGQSLFPVFIKDEDFHEPKGMVYSLLAGNGTFLVKDMELYSSSVQLDVGLPGLLHHESGVRPKFGRLPGSLMGTILGFFRTALLWHGGEAIVFLYYSRKGCSFCAKAPPQRVYRRVSCKAACTEPYVEYDRCDRPRDFIKLGTIHSHCHFRAYHSLIDQHDEKYEDGLHITIGRLFRQQPDISVSFVVNGSRFRLKPEDVLEGYGHYVAMDPPVSWLSQVTCVVKGYGSIADKVLKHETFQDDAATHQNQPD